MDLSIRHHEAGPAIRVDVRPPHAPPAPMLPVPTSAPAPAPERFVPLHGFGCSCGVCAHERFTGESLFPRETPAPITPKHDWQQVAPDLFYDRVTGTYTRI